MSVIFMKRPAGRYRKKSSSTLSVNLGPIPDETEENEIGLADRQTRSSYSSHSEDMQRSQTSSVTKGSAMLVVTPQAPQSKVAKLLEHLAKLYRKLGLSHLIPILVLLIYSLVGAALLVVVEVPHEKSLLEQHKIHAEIMRNHAVERLGKILKDKELTLETKLYASRDLILWYEYKLGYGKPPLLKWDMWGALFYVGTIFTTIGYGNIYARSTGGRIMSVIFALIGIPLALAILRDMGSVLSRRINQLWRWAKSRRMRSPTLPTSYQDEDMEDEIPVCVALLLTVFWMLFCAALFCSWETEWTYLTALYFFFISLSTIGFGDITPSRPRLMVINFGLVMIGLSLVSMTIQVIQRHIELFLYRMVEQMKAEYMQALGSGCVPDHQTLLSNTWNKQSWLMRHLASRLIGEGNKQRLVQCAQETVSRPPTRYGTLNDLRRAMSRHSIGIEVAPRCMRSSYAQTEYVHMEKGCQVGPQVSSTSAQVAVSLEASTVSYQESEMQTSIQVVATHDTASQAEQDQQTTTTQTEAVVELQDTEVQTESSYVKNAKRLFDLSNLRTSSLEVMAVPLKRIQKPQQ